jgi:hypothetical protein
MMRALLTAFAFYVLAVADPVAAEDLTRFHGTYVGRAEEVEAGGKPEQRDIDLVIEAAGRGGLKLSWTNVTLVDGRRDVPGVRRRTDEVILTPMPGSDLYIAKAAYDPFTEARSPDLAAGDPLRWASLAGDSLRVYSFVILENGTYELQTYTRTLTQEGVELAWRRLVDGTVMRQMIGHAVRAD